MKGCEVNVHHTQKRGALRRARSVARGYAQRPWCLDGADGNIGHDGDGVVPNPTYEADPSSLTNLGTSEFTANNQQLLWSGIDLSYEAGKQVSLRRVLDVSGRPWCPFREVSSDWPEFPYASRSRESPV